MSLKSGGGLTKGRGKPKSVQQQWLYSTQPCAAIHDDMTSLAGKHHVTTFSACGVRRGNSSAWLTRHEQIYWLVWFTWSIWWQSPSASVSIQHVGSRWGWWHQVWWNGESCLWDTCRKVLTVYLSEMQPLKRRRTVHILNELKPGSRWIRQLCRSTLQSCSCVVQL